MKYQFCLIFESKEEMDAVIAKLESKPKSQAKLPDETKESFYCDDCGKEVSQKVKDFCNSRFSGNVYCMTCQKKHREEQ